MNKIIYIVIFSATLASTYLCADLFSDNKGFSLKKPISSIINNQDDKKELKKVFEQVSKKLIKRHMLGEQKSKDTILANVHKKLSPQFLMDSDIHNLKRKILETYSRSPSSINIVYDRINSQESGITSKRKLALINILSSIDHAQVETTTLALNEMEETFVKHKFHDSLSFYKHILQNSSNDEEIEYATELIKKSEMNQLDQEMAQLMLKSLHPKIYYSRNN